MPQWSQETGELRIDSQVAKRFKNLNFKGKPTNVAAILAAFQEQGWPLRIANPLATRFGTNPRQLKDALTSLNDEMVGLRFSKDATGSGITWHRTATNDTHDESQSMNE